MKIEENILLNKLTTFRIGGPAKYYCEVGSENGISESVKFANEKKLPIFILGEGSDILMSDDGFVGLVIKYTGKLSDFKSSGKEVIVTAGAGMAWDNLVKICVDKGLQGIECMSGIPGTVGAAPIQNIGAYGQEFKDSFVSLNAFNIKDQKLVKFDKEECKFAYRDSIFKRRKYWQKFVIISVTLKLIKNGKPEIKYDSLKKYLEERSIANPDLSAVRNAVLDIRSHKFENYKEVPNAGSFFKNPIIDAAKIQSLKEKYSEIPCFDNGDGTYKCFAGWFIEQAGWKGKNIGNAHVSASHALILTNPSRSAKANEVKHLADMITNDVNRKFGVNLEQEVQYIG